MTDQIHSITPSRPWGDTAVDGLIAGLAAGIVMLAFLIVDGWLNGLTPAIVVGSFGPPVMSGPLTGLLLHLAVAGIYGILFALAVRSGGRRLRLGAGLVYGLLLWLLASTVTLPLADSPLLTLPPAGFLAAHTVFGLVLGGWLGRNVVS